MVERFVDIEEVISSILITPTIIVAQANFKLFTIFIIDIISHCLVIIAGATPDTIPNSKLSPSAPMVLCLRYGRVGRCQAYKIMKVASSLKSLKKRDLNSKLVKRRGKLYVINKKNPRFKARQG